MTNLVMLHKGELIVNKLILLSIQFTMTDLTLLFHVVAFMAKFPFKLACLQEKW